MHKKRRTARLQVRRVVIGEQSRSVRDTLVAEEPLTLLWQAMEGPSSRLLATMRTPGDDNELAAGLLYSEGLLWSRGELDRLSFCGSGGPNELNRIRAQLRLTREQAEARLSHRPSSSLPQSACGLCGVDELANPAALTAWAASQRPEGAAALVPGETLLRTALDELREAAPVFAATGAAHKAVIVDEAGRLLAAGEDVGRHNACDKAIGALLLATKASSPRFALPPGSGIVFSSRLSFELAAKAVRCGAAWVASVGAPTDLAIRLTQLCGLPTIGFLSHERYNVYVD